MVISLIILLLFLLRIMCVFMQGLHLSEDGHGIFNMHTDLNVCCAHEGKTGTNESVQVLTQKNRKMVLCPISTMVAAVTGSSLAQYVNH